MVADASGQGAVVTDRRPLGVFPAPPGSLTVAPAATAAQRWLGEAEGWLGTAGTVVARLDADAAAAAEPDTYAADVVLAVTLTQTVTERLRAVRDALGQGDTSALGPLCHGRRPVGTDLSGAPTGSASGGFSVAEAATLLTAVVDRLGSAVAADAIVASGVAPTVGALRERMGQLRTVAGTTGLVVDVAGWQAELDEALASQDPAAIRSRVTEVARRVAMFEQAVAQVADDQERARRAVAAAELEMARARVARDAVVALAAEVTAKIADPPRLGVPDPDALGAPPGLPTAADPGEWAQLADAAEAHSARCLRLVAALEQAEARYRTSLDTRDALRGLLGASRDRQLTRSASHDLDGAYRAAHEAVWTAPCDLDAARRLVDAYVTSVRAATPPMGPAATPARPGSGAPGRPGPAAPPPGGSST